MRVTIRELKEMKRRGERIPMLTAYDYTSAVIVEDAGIPLILVGDSLGQVVLGYDTTVPVTMDEMVHHVKAVVRGTQKAHVVADMPFMTYQADVSDALRNAGRLLKEGGAQSVKLEGGLSVVEAVRPGAAESVSNASAINVKGRESGAGPRLRSNTPSTSGGMVSPKTRRRDSSRFSTTARTSA